MIHAVGITTRRLASSCRVSPATLAGSCLRHPQHPSATVPPRHDTVLASALPSPAFRQPYSSTVAAATSDASTSEDSHQPRRNRLSHQVCVELRGLPSTATPSDIRRLSADIKTSNDIFKIELLRTIYLNPSGKALVYFTSETHAKYFHASASRRIVGGHQIHAHLLSRGDAQKAIYTHYYKAPVHLRLPLDLINHESGKLVLLSGIPAKTTEEKLVRKLSRRYDLAREGWWRGKRRSEAGTGFSPSNLVPGAGRHSPTHDRLLGSVIRIQNAHDDASTASYIVRLATVHEAHRLCRRWHNTYFTPQRFNIYDTGGRFRVEAQVLY